MIRKYQTLGAVALALLLALTGCGEGSKDDKKPMEMPRVPGGTVDNAGQVAAFEEGSASKVTPPSEKMQLAEGSSSDVDGHPVLDPNQRNSDRQIIIPASVAGKWKAVKLFVRNKRDEEQSRMQTLDLGSSFNLEGTALKVTVGPFLPNFVMDPAMYTSNGNTLANPAVRVVVQEGDNTVFEGWAFAKFPGMYGFEHDTYALQLMDFIPVEVS